MDPKCQNHIDPKSQIFLVARFARSVVKNETFFGAISNTVLLGLDYAE